ncbi:hypothetical protein [Aeoliella mucimassa]|nr:hypothetical protein [Aeoliella mucimassa]
MRCLLVVALLCGVMVSAVAEEPRPTLAEATGRALDLGTTGWKLFIPDTYVARDDAKYDLLIHFHGHPPVVWNNALEAKLNAVIVTVNYNGLSRAYSTPFSDPKLFGKLLDDIHNELRKQPEFGEKATLDQLAISSFSAGYGAVRELLKQPEYFEQIDAILAADSLYASTVDDGTPDDSQLIDYKRFAELAVEKQKTFLFTHSEVPTPTYESTVETGDELLAHLELTAEPSDATGLGTIEFYRQAKRGQFELLGARGDDGDAHMEHLRYIGEFFARLPLAKLPE